MEKNLRPTTGNQCLFFFQMIVVFVTEKEAKLNNQSQGSFSSTEKKI